MYHHRQAACISADACSDVTSSCSSCDVTYPLVVSAAGISGIFKCRDCGGMYTTRPVRNNILRQQASAQISPTTGMGHFTITDNYSDVIGFALCHQITCVVRDAFTHLRHPTLQPKIENDATHKLSALRSVAPKCSGAMNAQTHLVRVRMLPAPVHVKTDLIHSQVVPQPI